MMSPKEQAEHDHAVERFVDVTLNNCVALLRIVEADMKMADTEIPAEDEPLYVTVASRVYLGYKLFAGYGATLLMNDHIRDVLMAPGRKEINDDIEARLIRIVEWFDKGRKKNANLDKIISQMEETAGVAQQWHMGHFA